MKKLLLFSLLVFSLATAVEKTNNTLTNGGNIMLGWWYKYITPVDGPRCGFRPTCSEYARQCVKKYGLARGTMMASERLQRCNGCHNYSVYDIKDGYYDDPVSNNVY